MSWRRAGSGVRPDAWRLLTGAAISAGAVAMAVQLISGPVAAERRRAQPSPAAAASREATGTTPPSSATPAAIAAAAAAEPPPPPRPFTVNPAKTVGPPADIAGAKAYAVFESACASCHQARPGDALSASGGFGNVLDLAALERDPSLVRPGLADASRLYQTVLSRHAPLDVFRSNPEKALSIEDVETIRAWIEQVPAAPGCPDRKPITPAALGDLMQNWLAEVGAEAAKSTRFVSLAHIYNACASESDLAGYRQAAQKLLNSLSWGQTLARIETVGDGTALLAFRLADLGWIAAHWDRLAAAEPQGGAVKAPQAVKDQTGSQVPVLRADWLAYAAGRAPLYYELLGLPERQGELAKLAGIDMADSRQHRVRAGLKSAGETKGPRLLERVSGRDGHALWLSYDWAPGSDANTVFDQPLHPAQGRTGKPDAAHADGTRMVLTLPNGMLLFAAHDGNGRRVDQAGTFVSGQPCMACHATGVVPAADEMRAHLQGDRPGVTREARDAALALYPVQSELTQLMDDDAYRYRRVLVQAGIDPDVTIGGLELVTALARRYERDVDLARLAAEAGLDAAGLRKRLDALQGEARPLGQRLVQGVLPRADAERLLFALADPAGKLPPAAAAADDAAAKGAVHVPPPATVAGLGVSLWSDRPSYRVGDLVNFNVQVSEDCYLTLVNVDANGKATVLFPNDFEQENLVTAGTTVRVPGEKSPYQLRLKEKGQETAVAMCLAGQKLPAGIELDYERQRFPSLGLWRNFLSLTQSEEAESAKNPGRPKPPVRGQKGRTAEAKPEQPRPRSEAQGRAAIAVTIE